MPHALFCICPRIALLRIRNKTCKRWVKPIIWYVFLRIPIIGHPHLPSKPSNILEPYRPVLSINPEQPNRPGKSISRIRGRTITVTIRTGAFFLVDAHVVLADKTFPSPSIVPHDFDALGSHAVLDRLGGYVHPDTVAFLVDCLVAFAPKMFAPTARITPELVGGFADVIWGFADSGPASPPSMVRGVFSSYWGRILSSSGAGPAGHFDGGREATAGTVLFCVSSMRSLLSAVA